MYLVRTGSDQSRFTIPVVEVFQEINKVDNTLSGIVGATPTGIPICIWPEVNTWKVANDKTAFQVVLNIIHSLTALTIIIIGIYRLNQWWSETGSVWISIGTVCIVLEVISGILRFSYTSVDPFWSFRVLDDTVANILLSAHLPFTFSSGILLTFFWAETLSANRVRVSPFISEHKTLAIIVCVILFVAEITTGIVRTFLPVTSSFNPSFVSQALYVIVSLILTVSYVYCAIKIQKKTSDLSNRKRKIRNMTFRFAGSTGGYVAFCILVILLIPFISNPWGFKILMNMILFSSNWWSLLQVYSFVPPRLSRGRTTGHSSEAKQASAGAHSMRSDFSRKGVPQSPVHEEEIATSTSSSSSPSTSSSASEGLLDQEKEDQEEKQAKEGEGPVVNFRMGDQLDTDRNQQTQQVQQHQSSPSSSSSSAPSSLSSTSDLTT